MGPRDKISQQLQYNVPGGPNRERRFHAAAGELYSRLSAYKDVPAAGAPDGFETAEALLRAKL